MVDTVPDHLVIPTGCDTSADGEDEFPIEGCLQETEDLVSCLVVGEVGSSVCALEVYVASFAGVHAVVDGDSADVFIPITMHVRVEGPVHGTWGLISDHFPKNGGANGTPDPIFLSFHVVETALVQ